MNVFIVAIPLFDNEMKVEAYHLCAHDADTAIIVRDDFRDKNEDFALPGLEIISQIGIEPLAGDKPLFVDLGKLQFLAGRFGKMVSEENNLIWKLPKDLPYDDHVVEKLEQLKANGARLALSGLPAGGTENYLVIFASYIFLDFNDPDFDKQYKDIRKKVAHAKIVVFNIPDMTAYEKFSRDNNSLFSGSFYKNPITSGETDITPVKVNALKLLKQINEEDFELTEIAKSIERDPALSISLLRFINSAAVGLVNQVKSINNAVAILGQKEVRRWATVAISINLAQDRPGEITKLSMVRAKFAENLAVLFYIDVFRHSLFMAGLFSLLDVILKKPMEDAIKEVAVDKMVYEALVDKKGVLYKVMDFIYAYERADWNKISIIMIQNNMDGVEVNKAFVDALVWYNQILISIDEAEKEETEADKADKEEGKT
ncbi:MAG: HDOD domain-containing protein [Oscillospiraceae bacterium]|nr:HDOD domain-containing protein [Oscillospiraceae bacterium]